MNNESLDLSKLLSYTEPTFTITPPTLPVTLELFTQGVKVQVKTINGVNYNFAVYPLVNKFDQVLNNYCSEFDFGNPPIDPRFLAVSLIETMVKHQGVGLASPQIGLSYRCFVMGSGNKAFACFNPVILESSGADDFDEGCLSFKGLFLKIKRPDTIKVKYTDMNGENHEETFKGFTARIFQHELDHLNGVVYTSLVSNYTLEKSKQKVKSNLKKLKAQRDAQIKQDIINQATQKVIQETKAKELQESINLNIPDNQFLGFNT